jgi:hypothetical protein
MVWLFVSFTLVLENLRLQMDHLGLREIKFWLGLLGETNIINYFAETPYSVYNGK